MIELMFMFGTDHVLVVVDGNNVKFGVTSFGAQLANIEGLKLSKQGVEKEFPDLIGNPEWREIAISRFKDKIKSLDTEHAKVEYIINDLRKYGYKPYYKQIQGHRKEAIH